jgi:hypothetical protein
MEIEPLVELVTDIKGLNEVEEALPKPASHFVPNWWKKTPTVLAEPHIDSFTHGNVKTCPSFPDYFSKGFIVPMWVDSILLFDTDKDGNDFWRWTTSNSSFTWETHSKEQYLNHSPHLYFGKKAHFVFKTKFPWYVFTSPGYSLYQLPPFFHFNEDFSVVPGVRDTDVYHEMNIQIVIHSKSKEIFIPRGTPLAHFIPFKREKIDLKVRYATDEDKIKMAAHDLNLDTKFSHVSSYKAERKNINNNL